jgi:sugar phosphate isomerase/epimerase
MLIGAMNHPAKEIQSELAWMAEMKLEFVDLTVEPPETASWKINSREVRDSIERYGLKVVGHTAYYLPMGSAMRIFAKPRPASCAAASISSQTSALDGGTSIPAHADASPQLLHPAQH